MKLCELAEALENRGQSSSAARARLLEAARPFSGKEALSSELPPVPRYLGSGAWLEAIRTDTRRKK